MKTIVIILFCIVITHVQVFSQKKNNRNERVEDFITFYKAEFQVKFMKQRIIIPLTIYVNDTVYAQITDTSNSKSILKNVFNLDTTFYKIAFNINSTSASVSSFNQITKSTITENYIIHDDKWFMLNVKINNLLTLEEKTKKLDEFYEIASGKYVNNNMDAALQDVNYLIDYAPEQYSYYILRALIYQEKQEYTKAIDDYSIYLSYHDNLPVYIQRGYCSYVAKDYVNALSDFNYVIRSDNSCFDAYRYRSLVWGAINDSLRCEQDLSQAIKWAENVPANLKEIIQIAYDLSHYNKVIQAGRRYLHFNKEDSLIITIMCVCFDQIGQPDSAKYYFSILTRESIDLLKIDSLLTFKALAFESGGIKYTTDNVLAQDIAISFLKKGSEITMENVWRGKKSKSFGNIEDLKLSSYTHSTDTTYARKEYRFVWNYRNAYDSETGKCLGKLEMIFVLYKPEFTLTLFVLNTYEPIIIKGVLE